MADSREGVCDSSDESSDTIQGSKSEYSTSSENETDEEDLTEATTSSGGRKRSKTCRGKGGCEDHAAAKKKKRKVTALDSKEIEDLASWIFSSDEAKKVEQHIRSSLLNDPRVESQSDRKQFAKHLLCATEGSNFELLVTGFCRRFSQESFASNLQSYRKASFSVAWMKLLTNFQPGKITQERMIVGQLLRKAPPTIFSADCVHSVRSVVHETVYGMIHEHIRLKKAENEADEDSAGQRRRELPEESDDTLFRYCGAALQTMIKLRTETLAGKQGRGELSKKRKPVLEKELEILCELVMKDKSDISNSLKNSDEGNLTFPRAELIPFLRSVDREVRGYATDSNLKKSPSKFLKTCQNAVLNNDNLEADFRVLVASLVN